MNEMTAVKTDCLTKHYGDTVAVDALDIEIKKGEFVSLLGVNGAGKTTLVKMLCGIIRPDCGDAFICGHSITEDKASAQAVTGVSPQETAVAPMLTVKENLEFIAGIYGCEKSRADVLLKELSLENVSSKRAGKLSGGYARRLSIAMALVSDPEVVFLDEPTLGLDVIARRELWSFIEKMKGRKTVILTTHYLEEAESLSDRIAVIAEGRLKFFGTADDIKKKAGTDSFEDAFVKIASEVSV